MGLCWTCVPQGSVSVVERFGKFTRFAYPGFHCILPCLGDFVAGSISLRIRSLDVSCETKTKDNVFVTLVVSVQYQVSLSDDEMPTVMVTPHGGLTSALMDVPEERHSKKKLFDSFYKLTDSQAQIRAYIFDTIRATVPKMPLDDVFEAKEEIAQAVQTELAKAMSSFGYTIIQALVTDIDPASTVKAAMNDINAATRQRMAAVERAEARKIETVKAAEADAESKYLEGQGIARQRAAIIHGLRDSVLDFSTNVQGITNQDVMQMMLTTQYIDMLHKVGIAGRSNTVFLNHNPASAMDVGAEMRNGMLAANAGSMMMTPQAMKR